MFLWFCYFLIKKPYFTAYWQKKLDWGVSQVAFKHNTYLNYRMVNFEKKKKIQSDNFVHAR